MQEVERVRIYESTDFTPNRMTKRIDTGARTMFSPQLNETSQALKKSEVGASQLKSANQYSRTNRTA